MGEGRRRKAGIWGRGGGGGGGGGGDKLGLWGYSRVVVWVGWGGFCQDIHEYLGDLSRKRQSSVYSPYTITNFEKIWPSETSSSCIFVVCFLHTEQTIACLFSQSYIYASSCLPQTQKVVVSSQLHWLLVFWSAM